MATELHPYQQRIVEEKNQLVDRLDKLRVFLETDSFFRLDIVERGLLHSQFKAMCEYDKALGERIARF